MSYKIIISSSSTASLIEHSENVIVIPDIIRYSENEEYSDGQNITLDIFYNRLRHDPHKPLVLPPKNEDLLKLIAKASRDNDNVVVILPASGVIYYDEDNITEIVTAKHHNVTFYESKLVGYPLAYLISILEKNIDSGMSIDDALVILEKMESNTEWIFYVPKKDTLSISSFEKGMIKANKQDKFYRLSMASIVEINNYDFININDVLRYFIKKTDGIDVVPFIAYTNPISYFVDYLEEKLLNVFVNLKKINKVFIPAALGVKLGNTALGLGYIKKENRRNASWL